jgi:radical SAM-linked protein
MSLKQSYFRYRITFAKVDTAKFIGHLDLQNLFQKAIKRAKLPVAYSEGFNPHQLLSFAVPLPLGMAGHAEILEVFLTHKAQAADIISRLNSQMPMGLSIIGAEEVPAIGKSAAALVEKAAYSIIFSETFGLAKVIEEIISSENVHVEKEAKRKGRKEIVTADIRPDIFGLEVGSKCNLKAILACGSERNLKPEILAQHVLKVAGIVPKNLDITYERLEIGLKTV